jgi:hypothetical protein
MTGLELQNYLMSTGLVKCYFKDQNVYMVENIDGKIYNVPSYYKIFIPMLGKVEIKIYYNKHGDGTKYVDFMLGGVNLFGCYKLSELTLPILCKELNKFLSQYSEFKEWMTIELRNYKIESCGVR